jgi:hypothetical protein
MVPLEIGARGILDCPAIGICCEFVILRPESVNFLN